ncbi:MAG: hypothetical protein LBI18_11145 [Planctomycetaceae bacterium]|jgi:hypothetical protein|nr:hypothetical protein [Planctomycetaceae bacterium]
MFRRRAFTHHHVGDSRLDPVYGRQFVLPNGLESDCRLNTGSELPCGNATVDENPSAKGCLPFLITKLNTENAENTEKIKNTNLF